MPGGCPAPRPVVSIPSTRHWTRPSYATVSMQWLRYQEEFPRISVDVLRLRRKLQSFRFRTMHYQHICNTVGHTLLPVLWTGVFWFHNPDVSCYVMFLKVMATLSIKETLCLLQTSLLYWLCYIPVLRSEALSSDWHNGSCVHGSVSSCRISLFGEFFFLNSRIYAFFFII